jgi:hypothetical protein
MYGWINVIFKNNLMLELLFPIHMWYFMLENYIRFVALVTGSQGWLKSVSEFLFEIVLFILKCEIFAERNIQF